MGTGQGGPMREEDGDIYYCKVCGTVLPDKAEVHRHKQKCPKRLGGFIEFINTLGKDK